jgi:hypothetical protein
MAFIKEKSVSKKLLFKYCRKDVARNISCDVRRFIVTCLSLGRGKKVTSKRDVY